MPTMDGLAEQVVAWHNRNPLAKRISIFDVHTIGVVALPFVGGSASPRPQAAQALQREPVMDPLPAEPDAPAPEAQDAPPEPGTDASAAPTPAPALDAGPTLPAHLAPAGAGTPKALPAWLRWLPAPLRAWLPEPGGAQRLFSERFISQLSPRRIARFALKHGHREQPGEADWPQRAIAIDEGLMSKAARRGLGSWPYEIYLMSAGVDAGASRTRILMAYDADYRLKVLGRRCLNPLALAVLAALLLLFVGAPSLWLMGRQQAKEAPAAAASAPAASAAASVVAAPAGSAPPPATPASAASVAASPAAPASAAASEALPAEPAASIGMVIGESSEPAPDIRPQLVPRRADQADRPPLRSTSAAASAPAKTAPSEAQPPARTEAAAEGKSPPSRAAATPAAGRSPERALNEEAQERSRARATGSAGSTGATGSAGESSGAKVAAPSGKQVALVSPASASKAEAEAALERMRSLLGETVRDPSSLQGYVFQTHEGWRAAVWPFPSREEAQLVNAILVARGLRTRAVDF